MLRNVNSIKRRFNKVMCRIFYNKKTGRCLVLLFLILLIGFTYIWSPAIGDVSETQRQLDYIAKRLKVKVTSVNAQTVNIVLHNSGTMDITFGDWRIYFTSISPLHVKRSYVGGGMTLKRVNGGLNYLSPVKGDFKGIYSNGTLTFSIPYDSISRSGHMPNWYVASSSNMTSPKLIQSTSGYDAVFVEPFTTADQWKRNRNDMYDPYSPEQRHELYSTLNPGFVDNISIGRRVIPTPTLTSSTSDDVIRIDGSWTILTEQKLLPVSRFLAERLRIKSVLKSDSNKIQASTDGRVIIFTIDKSFLNEEYLLHVKYPQNIIAISSKSEIGAFYAIQTMLSLLSDTNTIPVVAIKDMPRFPYRGLMVDVARNFVSKETMLKIIDLLAMYKLNVLHLHLTDDEGWRLEIPAIPELTSYASRRCHNREEKGCLQPSLGSGPTGDGVGSGFYTVSDFKEILQYAADRFVKVIPEIDVPGHSLAAIEAMRFREDAILQRSGRGDYSDSSYVLTDKYIPVAESVQGWRGNAVNPCLNSTYRFINVIFQELKAMYDGIQDINIVHIGGDEVPNNVWMTSTSCRTLIEGQHYDERMLKKMFMVTVAGIAARHDMDIATWEDGMYEPDDGPYSRKLFLNRNVYVNAWNNIWKEGRGGRAIEFANAGYSSILSMATHLYLDHPYEPDPEERGLYWATRFSDTYKIFGFMPDDLYSNIDFDSNGIPLSKNDICRTNPCPALRQQQNVQGMEACLWTETIRNSDHLFYMLLPRLIAYAERSWHNATWEYITDKAQRNVEKFKDWEIFLNVLARKELPKIERLGVSFRVPPPGVKIDKETNSVHVNSLYPGFTIEMSLDGSKWTKIKNQIPIPSSNNVASFRVISLAGSVQSRPIEIRFARDVTSGAIAFYPLLCQFLIHMFVVMTLIVFVF